MNFNDRAYYRVSVDPLYEPQDRMNQKGAEEIFNHTSQAILFANSLDKSEPSMIRIGSIFDPYIEGVAFEARGSCNAVSFWVNSAKKTAAGLEEMIRSVYPVTRIRQYENPDKDIAAAFEITKGGLKIKDGFETLTGTFVFSGADISMIATAKERQFDFFNSILSYLSIDSDDLFARYQVVISPVEDYWKEKFRKYDSKMSNQRTNAIMTAGRSVNTETGVRSRIETIAKEKIMNPTGYLTTIRIFFVYKKGDQVATTEARGRFSNVKAIIETLAHDRIKLLKVSEKGSFFRNYYRAAQYEGALAKGSILVPSEIFSVYHLPIPKNQLIPRLEIERFRRIPISKDILLPNFDEKEHLFLGKNDYSTRIIPFALDNQARFRHIFTIGQTGVGKSTAMVNSILQDIWHGRGCCVIDPHGDLVDDIMKHFPDPSIPGNPDRTKDVIYIDFADEKNFVGINLLEVDSEAEITVVITSLSNMLKKLYPESGESMGPVFQKYLSGVFRTALLTRRRGQKNGLYDPTITIALRLLSNKDYRQFAIQKLEDMEFTGKVDLLNFWKEHEKITGEKSKSQAKDEMSLHIITKFQNFIDNMFIGNIVNQKQSRVNFAEAMDSNKIILCRMNKGQLGEDTMKFLGLLVVQKILQSAFKRNKIPEENRVPFYMYVDEFQNFISKEFESILSEARKYRLALFVANQYLKQLEDGNDTSVRDAVLGNVGTIVAFRVGSEDGEILERQFGDPINLPKESFTKVDNYSAYVKSVGNKENSEGERNIRTIAPFHITMEPTGFPLLKNTKLIEDIISESKAAYTRTQAEIMREDKNFMTFFPDSPPPVAEDTVVPGFI